MEPLDALAEGTKRIQENDLTQKIAYEGELEFENVCAAFNDMQESILAEQEKNRKYEKARTDMIAGISHDLRTPLTAMKGTLKGLIDGVASTPEQQEKFLQAAYRRTGDMDMLFESASFPVPNGNRKYAGFDADYRNCLFSEKIMRYRATPLWTQPVVAKARMEIRRRKRKK